MRMMNTHERMFVPLDLKQSNGRTIKLVNEEQRGKDFNIVSGTRDGVVMEKERLKDRAVRDNAERLY